MKAIRKYLGIIWMIAGPAAIIIMLVIAINNITLSGSSDINRPLPWIIILSIFTPIAIGLTIFGWYAWKGEYETLPEDTPAKE